MKKVAVLVVRLAIAPSADLRMNPIVNNANLLLSFILIVIHVSGHTLIFNNVLKVKGLMKTGYVLSVKYKIVKNVLKDLTNVQYVNFHLSLPQMLSLVFVPKDMEITWQGDAPYVRLAIACTVIIRCLKLAMFVKHLIK